MNIPGKAAPFLLIGGRSSV